jgi:hypothetical protein
VLCTTPVRCHRPSPASVPHSAMSCPVLRCTQARWPGEGSSLAGPRLGVGMAGRCQAAPTSSVVGWQEFPCSALRHMEERRGFYLCAIIKVCNYPQVIKKFERSHMPLVETFFYPPCHSVHLLLDFCCLPALTCAPGKCRCPKYPLTPSQSLCTSEPPLSVLAVVLASWLRAFSAALAGRCCPPSCRARPRWLGAARPELTSSRSRHACWPPRTSCGSSARATARNPV